MIIHVFVRGSKTALRRLLESWCLDPLAKRERGDLAEI